MKEMLVIIAVCFLMVTISMLLDLAAGLYKASQKGVVRTSEGLRRTASKMIIYYGSVIMAGCGDVVIYLSNFYDLIGLSSLHNYPVVAALVTLFLIACELMSLREKADKKAQKRAKEAQEVLVELFRNKDVQKVIETLAKSGKQ
ncbi:MAG: phage holin family protein [Bacteroidales bacterium]|nr:phage holin family protein [Bacteroidales bacterium]